jgi:hypothetical protein
MSTAQRPLVEINPTPTPLSSRADLDLSIRSPATDFLAPFL